MLGFVQEIVLLALDDRQGRSVDLPPSAADVVLGGAALMELALRNRVDTDLKRLIVVDASPTGDDILDDVLTNLAKADAELSTGAAIRRVTVNAGKYRKTALQQLVANDILRETGGGFLRVVPAPRHPAADAREQREVRTRLRQILLTNEIPDPRDVALICLIDAGELLGFLLNPDEIEKTAARIEQLRRMDLIGQAVMRAVEDIRFMVRHAALSIS